MRVPLIVAEIVFPSATLEVRMLLNAPLLPVVPELGVSVLPDPVAESATLAPLIVLPFASLAVTVIVEDPLPAVNAVGAALTVDCEAESGPEETVTVAVWVIATSLAVAVTVFDPA